MDDCKEKKGRALSDPASDGSLTNRVRRKEAVKGGLIWLIPA
jgi:hypothetical protein